MSTEVLTDAETTALNKAMKMVLGETTEDRNALVVHIKRNWSSEAQEMIGRSFTSTADLGDLPRLRAERGGLMRSFSIFESLAPTTLMLSSSDNYEPTARDIVKQVNAQIDRLLKRAEAAELASLRAEKALIESNRGIRRLVNGKASWRKRAIAAENTLQKEKKSNTALCDTCAQHVTVVHVPRANCANCGTPR